MTRPSCPRRVVLSGPELLEDRTVPAAIQFNQVGPVLTITGTVNDDIIRIEDNGVGTFTVFCPPNPVPSVFVGINTIRVFTLRGNDFVRYNLSPTGSFSAVQLQVQLGRGDDTFRGTLNGADLFSSAALRFEVSGQGGRDTLILNALNNVDFRGGSLDVRFFGDAAPGVPLDGVDFADRLLFSYQGLVSNTLRSLADGGAGRDLIVGNINLSAGSSGVVFARERGRSGADTLQLNIVPLQPVGQFIPTTVIVDALISGGSGVDACTRTPNVVVVGCP
jgi:hypothetical protein